MLKHCSTHLPHSRTASSQLIQRNDFICLLRIRFPTGTNAICLSICCPTWFGFLLVSAPCRSGLRQRLRVPLSLLLVLAFISSSSIPSIEMLSTVGSFLAHPFNPRTNHFVLFPQ